MAHEAATVVGVAGGSGAGKTTFVRSLVEMLPPRSTVVLSHDAYYRDLSHLAPDDRAGTNFDHPDSLDTGLLCEHVRRLQRGEAVEAPTYDFAAHTRTAVTTTHEPTSILIVEGILILADDALRALLDLAVYIDVDPDVRLGRRLERDVRERGRSPESVLAQWGDTVKPMHEAFVHPSRLQADIIVPHGGANATAARLVAAYVRAHP